MSVIGVLFWFLGGCIWLVSQSAIHEILSAIIILNGTIFIAAGGIKAALVAGKENMAKVEQVEAPTPIANDEWKCRCNQINLKKWDKCPYCGRSQGAIN